MINRDYKEFSQGEWYHVYNRGNGRMDIFCDEEDYKLFLYRLKENLFPENKRVTMSPKRGLHTRKTLPSGAFTIACYCLMPNHFHILIRQNTDLPISKLIGKVCTGYSMCFNKKNHRVGSIFQDTFKAVLIESNEQLLWLSAYIHQNPHVAGLVKNSADWEWGSYPDYINARKGIICDKDIILGQFKNIKEYKDFVDSSFELIKNKKDFEKLVLDETFIED